MKRPRTDSVGHSMGVLKIRRLHSHSVPSHFQNARSGPSASLLSAFRRSIYLFGENDVVQADEKTGSAKPHGRAPQGSSQPGGSGGASTARFAGR
jgi:hypothetical protein